MVALRRMKKRQTTDIDIDWDFPALLRRIEKAGKTGKVSPALTLDMKALKGEISSREYLNELKRLTNAGK